MTDIQEKDSWSSDAYQKAAGFVPKLATKVVQWLDVQPDDHILDIGCGDGILTCHIAQSLTTGSILGIDSSPSMIASAQQLKRTTLPPTLSPHCNFLTLNAHSLLSLSTSPPSPHHLPLPPLTKVFSNAALHWILATTPTTRASVFQAVHALLRDDGDGVFVFEMGGHGNVSEIRAALIAATAERVGVAAAEAADPWFFPDEAWMRAALEEQGFVVERMELERRPTAVQEGEGGGLEGWVRLMGSAFLDVVGGEGSKEREECVTEVVRRLEAVCRVEEGKDGGGGGFVMGYVRLRVLARKRKRIVR